MSSQNLTWLLTFRHSSNSSVAMSSCRLNLIDRSFWSKRWTLELSISDLIDLEPNFDLYRDQSQLWIYFVDPNLKLDFNSLRQNRFSVWNTYIEKTKINWKISKEIDNDRKSQNTVVVRKPNVPFCVWFELVRFSLFGLKG